MATQGVMPSRRPDTAATAVVRSRTGQEAGSQRVTGETSGIEPDAGGMGLDDLGYAAVGQPGLL